MLTITFDNLLIEGHRLRDYFAGEQVFPDNSVELFYLVVSGHYTLDTNIRHCTLVDGPPHGEACSQNEDVKSVVEQASQAFGSVNILVNCAALTNNLGSVTSMEPERWRKELEVSLTGPYLWSREVLPFMRKDQWGRILNISSTNALTGQPGVPAYVAAKGGLNSLTRQIAREQASRGITCNALVLGPVNTGIYDAGIFDQNTVESMVKRVPLGRMGTPEEVASLAAYICSPLASFLTGELITLDGGMTLGC